MKHFIVVDENAVGVLERSLLGWAGILRLTGEFRPTDQTNHEADLIARTAAKVQEHKGRCDCNKPPVLGGTHG